MKGRKKEFTCQRETGDRQIKKIVYFINKVHSNHWDLVDLTISPSYFDVFFFIFQANAGGSNPACEVVSLRSINLAGHKGNAKITGVRRLCG